MWLGNMPQRPREWLPRGPVIQGSTICGVSMLITLLHSTFQLLGLTYCESTGGTRVRVEIASLSMHACKLGMHVRAQSTTALPARPPLCMHACVQLKGHEVVYPANFRSAFTSSLQATRSPGGPATSQGCRPMPARDGGGLLRDEDTLPGAFDLQIWTSKDLAKLPSRQTVSFC